MRKRTEKKLRARAYHEAGHAVVAYVLQFPFRRISIVEDEETLWRVLRDKWFKKFGLRVIAPDLSMKQIEKAIITLYAGGEAEHIFTGTRNWVGSRSDDMNAEIFAGYVIAEQEEELPAYLTWLAVRTRNILTAPQNWRAVEKLAEALLERQEIGIGEARDVIVRGMRTWAEEQASGDGAGQVESHGAGATVEAATG